MLSNRRRKSSRVIKKSADFSLSSTFAKRLAKRILNDSSQNGILRKGDRVLLAFSGGPDSSALFHILLSLRKGFGIDMFCAHVNYRLRGNDSDKDEALVRKYCEKYTVPLFVLHPKGISRRSEEELRTIRYQFFKKISQKHEINAIATAHTSDDQAETFVLRLLRGSGSLGLGAIRTKQNGIIRPLLGTSKRDILRFLKEECISFRNDKSNNDTNIIRNRVRHKLIPLLEREYQPNIREVLARTAEILSKEYDEKKCPVLPCKISGAITFSRKTFLLLSEATRSEELRRFYKAISRTGKNPSAAFIREAEKLIGSRKGKVRRFESLQLKIEARGDTVTMIKI